MLRPDRLQTTPDSAEIVPDATCLGLPVWAFKTAREGATGGVFLDGAAVLWQSQTGRVWECESKDPIVGPAPSHSAAPVGIPQGKGDGRRCDEEGKGPGG